MKKNLFPKEIYVRIEEDYFIADNNLSGINDGKVALYQLVKVGDKTTESTITFEK